MQFTTETPVGQIAATHPLATRVFSRYEIDFCCGGGVTLENACEARGLDPDFVLTQIQEVSADPDTPAERWDRATLSELVQHILDHHHEPLKEELPRLEQMLRKVVRVHGARDPKRLPALLETYLQLESELLDHMEQEEQFLFPSAISRDRVGHDGLRDYLEEHAATGQALVQLRELTDGFRAPDGACTTWRALWCGLEALEQSLHQHIHLENNVLFPRLEA